MSTTRVLAAVLCLFGSSFVLGGCASAGTSTALGAPYIYTGAYPLRSNEAPTSPPQIAEDTTRLAPHRPVVRSLSRHVGVKEGS